MQSTTLHSQSHNSKVNPSVVNPDGSDKNFGGFDENGLPLNQTTEKYPDDASNPGDQPNYPKLHKNAGENKGKPSGQNKNNGSNGSIADNDGEEEVGRRGDNPLNEKFSTNRGHKPPGDESITNRGQGSGKADK